MTTMTKEPTLKRYPSDVTHVTLSLGLEAYNLLKQVSKRTHRSMASLAAIYILRGLREDGYRVDDKEG